jgi:hypothetical protein
MCSECHQRGHTCTSRHCPIRIQANIAEEHQFLQENELLQASQISNKSQAQLRAAVVSPTLSTDSFHTADLFADALRVPPLQISANGSENAAMDLSTTNDACQRTPTSPQRTFYMPSPTRPIGFGILCVQDSNTALSHTPTPFELSQQRLSVSPLAVSQQVARPLSPFPPNCPEMVYSRYLEEKQLWLAQNPYVDAKDYRVARGWEILSIEMLRDQVHTMPLPQIHES